MSTLRVFKDTPGYEELTQVLRYYENLSDVLDDLERMLRSYRTHFVIKLKDYSLTWEPSNKERAGYLIFKGRGSPCRVQHTTLRQKEMVYKDLPKILREAVKVIGPTDSAQ